MNQMIPMLKNAPTGTDEIHEELSHWLDIHHTYVAYIAVQTKYGAPFILIYTIKTDADFDSAVAFIQTAREDGAVVGLYSRTDVRHRMGTVARKILAHEPEHPYRQGLRWLVADAEDGMRYETDEALFGKSVDFYNLVVASTPDRYQYVFGTAVADMQRKRGIPSTGEVSELRIPDPDDDAPKPGIKVRKPDWWDDDPDDEPKDEPKDTHTVGHGKPDPKASYIQSRLF